MLCVGTYARRLSRVAQHVESMSKSAITARAFFFLKKKLSQAPIVGSDDMGMMT